MVLRSSTSASAVGWMWTTDPDGSTPRFEARPPHALAILSEASSRLMRNLDEQIRTRWYMDRLRRPFRVWACWRGVRRVFPATHPSPRCKPQLVVEQPLRGPGDDGSRQPHPRFPFSLSWQKQAEAFVRIEVRRQLAVPANERRIGNPRLW